jgi:hypothetical protein
MLDRLNPLIVSENLTESQRNIMADFKRQVERGRELTVNQMNLLEKFEKEANRQRTFVDLDDEENQKRAFTALFYYDGEVYYQRQRDAICRGRIDKEEFDKICMNKYAEGNYKVNQTPHKFSLDEVVYCSGELAQVVKHRPSKDYGAGTLVYGIITLADGRLRYTEEKCLKTRTRKKKE